MIDIKKETILKIKTKLHGRKQEIIITYVDLKETEGKRGVI